LQSIAAKIGRIKDSKIRVICRLILEHGLIPKEISTLQTKDIVRGILRLPAARRKNNKSLKIKLSRKIKGDIRKIRVSGYIFSTRQSPHISARRIEQLVKNELGINCRELRNCFFRDCTDLDQAGITIGSRETIAESDLKKLVFNKEHERMVFCTLYETGCRVSELTDLKRGDVSQGYVTISGRKVPVNRQYMRLVRKNRQKPKDYLISGRKQLTHRRIQQIFAKYAGHLGRKLTPRILRNNYAYRHYKNGISGKEIGRLMGIKIGLHTHGIK